MAAKPVRAGIFVVLPAKKNSKLRPGAASSDDVAPPGLSDSLGVGTTNRPLLWSCSPSPQRYLKEHIRVCHMHVRTRAPVNALIHRARILA
jgi:hypothetical protein